MIIYTWQETDYRNPEIVDGILVSFRLKLQKNRRKQPEKFQIQYSFANFTTK